jgi:hypothetical protein
MASETRARRRIRKAIESRGFTVESIEWEPWYDGGEMSGICGGWSVTTTEDFRPHTHPGNDVCGLSVEDTLADIDWSIPAGPCACIRPRHYHPSVPIKGDPQKPLHDPDCEWFIRYRLPWWKAEEDQ